MEQNVLTYFADINRIPRGSGNEKAVSDYIAAWARGHGLSVVQDEIYDLVIQKPATPGYEDAPSVILQAHMDMVCEKTPESAHDFTKDPILLKQEGDWIVSGSGTSLGADNGIGVASAMAILAAEDIAHPALEVIFTVEEETSFRGAEEISKDLFHSHRMINLDHADDSQLIVGSCGGTGIRFRLEVERDEKSATGGACEGADADRQLATGDWSAYHLTLSGLRGGHSGEDIHRGHGNALRMMWRVLQGNPEALRVSTMDGGNSRTAIAREAEAVAWVQAGFDLEAYLGQWKAAFQQELGEAGESLELRAEAVPAGAGEVEQSDQVCEAGEAVEVLAPLTKESFRAVQQVMNLLPDGVNAMYAGFDGAVESSDNIGIVHLQKELYIEIEVRGQNQSSVEDIASRIELLGQWAGAETERFCEYRPWSFRGDSAMVNAAQDTYMVLFGEKMQMLAVHAGLECGSFLAKDPAMDIISIGPNCQYFHSVSERVSVSSVAKFYKFLVELLKNLR